MGLKYLSKNLSFFASFWPHVSKYKTFGKALKLLSVCIYFFRVQNTHHTPRAVEYTYTVVSPLFLLLSLSLENTHTYYSYSLGEKREEVVVASNFESRFL